jgi:hypothetical protein
MLELNTTPGRTRLVDLPSAVEELGFAPTHVRTLSVYVDTSPPRIRGPAYLLSFRERCRTVPAGVVAEDEDAFEVARARAEHYLVDQSVPRRPGLALFAAGEFENMMVVPLPAAPVDHIAWSEQPFIAPLEAMLPPHAGQRCSSSTSRLQLRQIPPGASKRSVPSNWWSPAAHMCRSSRGARAGWTNVAQPPGGRNHGSRGSLGRRGRLATVGAARGGATFGVPSRRESEWLPPRRRRRLADGAESP